MEQLFAEWVVSPDRVGPGRVRIGADGRIEAVEALEVAAFPTAGIRGRWLVPGFLDLQVNGYAGVDAAQLADPAAAGRLGRALADGGVTGYLPTIITQPPEDLFTALAAAARATAAPRAGGARILGIHLEGPFLSPGRRGAHDPDAIQDPDPVLLAELLAAGGGHIRLVTLAPERPGALALIEQLTGAGVKVSLGHSQATAEEVEAAIERGATGVTHLYNAMPSLHHRRPGLVGMGLTDERLFPMLITDGIHLSPPAVAVALKSRGSAPVGVVSDTVPPAGLPDGEVGWSGRRLRVTGHRVTLDDGVTLAGSGSRLDRNLRWLYHTLQIPVPRLAAMASTYPAAFLGETERGAIVPGHWADLVLWSEDLRPLGVWVEGVRQPG